MKIRDITTQDVAEVAKLHIQGISTGFVSSLGIDFVMALYEAIAQSEASFGFVAEENSKVLGFVAFTTKLDKLYKSVIVKEGWRFALLSVGKMFSFATIKKVFETLFYPSRIRRMNLPSAELLSIVIAPEGRGKGLATQLVKKGFQQCQKRGIDKVKVLVGADNEPANKLYLKCRFELAGQTDSHGVPSNIYVAQTSSVWPT